MQSFNTVIPVSANGVSAGQTIDFKGEYVSSLVITNNSGISIQYSLGSGVWTTVATGATATVGVQNPSAFRIRKAVLDASPGYPVPVDVSWTSAPDETVETAINAIFAPLTDDTAGILSAAQTAFANGGGIVQLKPIRYDLTGALPLLKNVMYRGTAAPWRMFGHESIDGGTRLIGDATQDGSGRWVNGSFNCFDYNATDRGSPYGSEAEFKESEQFGAGVADLIMEQFAYGIKAGALYEGGCAQLRLDNVVALRCSEWGYWLENCDAIQGGTIVAMDNQKGQFAFLASGSSAHPWNFGDGHIKSIFCQAPRGSGSTHVRSKGIMFRCRGQDGDINDLLVSHIGINGLSNAYSVASTFTSGNAAIAVPDISQFGVDNAVYFGSTLGGFTSGRVYFVTSVSGDTGAGTITLSKDVGGTNIVPSANGTPTIYNYGYTLVEFSGEYAGSTGKITYSNFPHIDAESNGTVGIVMQAMNGCRVRSNSTVGNKGVALRKMTRYNELDNCSSSTAIDCDDDSKKMLVTGVKPVAGKISWNMTAFMGVEDAYYGIALYLAALGTDQPDIWVGDTAWPAINMGRQVRHKKTAFSAALTADKNSGDVLVYEGAGGHTLTLPAVVDLNVGVKLFVSNPGAGSLTVATTSSQAIIAAGTSATSYTMTTLTNATFVACKTGSTFYWARY